MFGIGEKCTEACNKDGGGTTERRANKALQTDERRVAVEAFRKLTPAPLAAERQIRYVD
jgi:hypothetical protein